MSIVERFARQVRDSLRNKYGRLPSAAFVSIHFNRQTGGLRQVSSETVRRWMRGDSMPNQFHFQVMTAWLGLDANEIVRGVQQSQPLEFQQVSNGHSTEVNRIADSISRLSPETRRKLLDLIAVLDPH